MHRGDRVVWLIVLLVALLVFVPVVSPQDAQGCCISAANGCQDSQTAASCPNPPAGDFQSGTLCSQFAGGGGQCEVGCCCQAGQATPGQARVSCSATSQAFHAGSFTQDQCRIQCGAQAQECQATTCSAPNSAGCLCGTVTTTAVTPFCCATSNQVFATAAQCPAHCRVEAATYSILGTVRHTNGSAMSGVRIIENEFNTENLTLINGKYDLRRLPSDTYSVRFTKNGFLTNTSTITILNNNVTWNVVLIAVNAGNREQCDTAVDDDNDGFINQCDSDCNTIGDISSMNQSTPVPTEAGKCSDVTSGGLPIDNDCDGRANCEDSDCAAAPECQQGPQCGNNILEVDEECDGALNGNCNGAACIAPGQTHSCTCPIVCGNGLLQGNEQCDVRGYDANGHLVDGIGYDVDCPGLCNSNTCECPTVEPICGDGNRQGQEECDCGEGTSCDNSLVCGSGSCIRAGQVNACSCEVDFVCGNNQIELFEECDGTSTPVGCENTCVAPGRPNQCTCPSTCSSDPVAPVLTSVSPVKAEKKFRLEWTLATNQCEPEFYTLRRCEGTALECAPPGGIFSIIASGVQDKNYVDASVRAEQGYCYQVGARFESSVLSSTTLFSDRVCVRSGDEECFVHSKEFCDGERRIGCNENNFQNFIEDCSLRAGNICVGPLSNGNSECRFQSLCEKCGSPFGVFLQDASVAISNGAQRACRAIPTCFLDYTSTTIDKYYQCSRVDSCYDYRSKSACLGDDLTCNIGDCVWTDSDFIETGVGVCRPKNATEQDCSRCSVPYNSLYGECDANLCGLFGDCYFSNDLGGGVCQGRGATACVDYATQTDCAPQRNVTIDRIFLEGEAIGGSHAVRTVSDDKFGLGKCVWLDNQNKCIKDANGDGSDDTSACGAGFSLCRSDYTPPETFIDHIKVSPKSVMLNFSTKDDVSPVSEIHTYFGFGKQFTYPTEEFFKSFSLRNSITESDFYVVSYYSVDKAQNLEVVRNFTIFVDSAPPVITVSTLIRPNFASTPVESDLFINVTVTDNVDNQSVCSGGLTRDGVTVEPNNQFSSFPVSFRALLYRSLRDGFYTLSVSCRDHSGNARTLGQVIQIEADKSINSLTPNSTIAFQRGVRLQARTEKAATCRFSDTFSNFSQMNQSFVTNDNLHHFSTVDVFGPPNHTKLFTSQFNVRCRLNADGTIIGNTGDQIRFSVDMLPPVTKIDNFVRNQYKHTNFALNLVCEDAPLRVAGFPTEFGCAKTQLSVCPCSDPYNVVCPETSTGCTPFSEFGTSLLVNTTTRVRFLSEDNGKNRESLVNATILIDKIRPTFNITVRDPMLSYGEVRILSRQFPPDYVVEIRSSEPLDNVSMLAYSLSNNRVFNISLPTPRPGLVEWRTGLSLIGLDDVRSDLEFSIEGFDIHQFRGTQIVNNNSFTIDTTRPGVEIDPHPIRETAKYQQIIRQVDGAVYTTHPTFVIPGVVSQREALVNLYGARTVGGIRKIAEYKPPRADEVTSLATTAGRVKGSDNLLFGSNSPVEERFYLRTDNDRKYPFFKEFYKVTGVTQDSGHTRVSVTPVLEANVLENINVSFYIREMLDTRWKFTSSLSTGFNFFQLNALTSPFNPGNFTPVVSIFQDDSPPALIMTSIPRDKDAIKEGESSLQIFIRELVLGSGFVPDSFHFTLNGDNTPLSVSFIETQENKEYTILRGLFRGELSNSEYNVSVGVKDKAGNVLNYNFTFYRVPTAVSRPSFRLQGGIERNGIWHVRSSTFFEYTFPELVKGMDVDPVSVLQMPASPLNQTDGSRFSAQMKVGLADGLYTINASALAPQGLVRGHWTFPFIVDSQPPSFSVALDLDTVDGSRFVRENQSFIIEAVGVNDVSDIVNATLIVSAFDLDNGTNPVMRHTMSQTAADEFVYTYTVPQKAKQDSVITFSIVLTDVLGNTKTLGSDVKVDNVIPGFEILQVIADEVIVRRIGGEPIFLVQDQDNNVSIRGRVTGLRGAHFYKGISEVSLLTDSAGSFVQPVELFSRPGEISNNWILFEGRDLTDKIVQRIVKIISDRQGPSIPQITFLNREDGVVTSPLPRIRVGYNEPVVLHPQITRITTSAGGPVDAGFTQETIDNTTIVLSATNPMADGNYKFFVSANDLLGNAQETPTEASFEIKAGETKIFLIRPRHGFASTNPFNITVFTDRLANCRYTRNPNLSTGTFTTFDGEQDNARSTTHFLRSFQRSRPEFGVECSDGLRTVQEQFSLFVETTDPVIMSATANPPVISQLVNNKLQTTVSVVTDKEKTVCKHSQISRIYADMNFFHRSDDNVLENSGVQSTFAKNHSQLFVFDSVTPTARSIFVQCEDLSGRLSPVVAVPVEIRAQELAITVQSPPAVVSQDTVQLKVATNKMADCDFSLDGGALIEFSTDIDNVAKLDHSHVLSSLSVGQHSVRVHCDVFSDLNGAAIESKDLTTTFVFDNTPPTLHSITLPNVTCENGNGEYDFKPVFSASDNVSEIAGYNFTVMNDLANAVIIPTQFSESATPIVTRNVTSDRGYKVVGVAIDRAGNPSSSQRSNTVRAQLKTSRECRESEPPRTSLSVQKHRGGANVTITCSDRSGCDRGSFEYGLSIDNTCFPELNYTGVIILSDSQTVCWVVCDTLGNCVPTQKQYIDLALDDSDGDGVPDCGYDGCCASQTTCRDTGDDDQCPGTVLKEPVDAQGCSEAQREGEDIDRDGIPTSIEDANGNGVVDSGETDPRKADTDGDGLNDGQEDVNKNGKVDTGETDPRKADTDNDGLKDGEEIRLGTDPLVADTDKDGMPDGWEVSHGLNPLDASDAGLDPDSDGLSNLQEFMVRNSYGDSTDPNREDTDGDGISDGEEMEKGWNPLDPDSPYPRSGGEATPFVRIMSLFLIVLALLFIAGGSGYLVYKNSKHKGEGGNAKRVVSVLPEVRPLQMDDGRTKRLLLLRKHLQEKIAERKRLFHAFDENARKEVTIQKAQPKTPSILQPTTTLVDDVFHRLKRVGQDKDVYDKIERFVKYKPVDVHTVSPGVTEGVFNELAKLSGTSRADPFKALNDTLGTEKSATEKRKLADEVLGVLERIAKEGNLTGKAILVHLVKLSRESADPRMAVESVVVRLWKDKILVKNEISTILLHLHQKGYLSQDDLAAILYSIS